jgi:phospho-N-acetylmuramoyl-pentapeptide-transferase
MYYLIASFALSLGVSLLIGKLLIPFLRAKKLGQKILDIGPAWHKSKEGTPVMGGLLFIGGCLAAFAFFGFRAVTQGELIGLLTLVMALCYGLVGFIDDYTKLIKKQNKGLSAGQKFVMQLFIASIYIMLLRNIGMIGTRLYIPFTPVELELGIAYYILCIFGVVYFVNCTNLSDGIDGLVGSMSAAVAVFFIIGFIADHNYRSDSGLVISGGLLGGLLGFLFYNLHPAKIWMGDTGSLFLGGLIAGLALWLQMPLILVIVGAVYIFEGLSVVIQVTSFKLTGKRVFKMSPYHHSLELRGWSERRIVCIGFSITALLCAVSALLLILP